MQKQPVLLKALNALSLVLVAAALWMVVFYAPLEAVMGLVQKVFYFHVANAWVGMLGFVAAAAAGIAYLVTKDVKWDIVEVAAVEISLVFFFIAIVTGSIWAYPAWNTWWTWDPRLTTAAVLEMIYLAYMLLRQGIDDPDRRARFGAVYTLIGGLSVPLTFLSIRLFRTIHPVVIGGGNGGDGGFSMTQPMLNTMFFSLFVFSVVFITLFWHRIRLGRMQHRLEQLKLRAGKE